MGEGYKIGLQNLLGLIRHLLVGGGARPFVLEDPSGTTTHYRSGKILDLEEDVVLTRDGFYRVIEVMRPGGGLDQFSRLARRMKPWRPPHE